MKTLLLTLALVLSVSGAAAAATAPDGEHGLRERALVERGDAERLGEPERRGDELVLRVREEHELRQEDLGSERRLGHGSINVSAPVSGLDTGTLYHFRLVATSDGGESRGADQTFTPPRRGAPVGDDAASATSISTDLRELRGTVNPNGQSTTLVLRVRNDDELRQQDIGQERGLRDENRRACPTTASGLTPGRTTTTGSSPRTPPERRVGADQTFTTLAPPAVTTGAAQGVGTTTATLTGPSIRTGASTTW